MALSSSVQFSSASHLLREARTLAPGSSGVFAPDLTSPLFLFMLIAVPKSHDYSKQGQEVGEGWQPNIQRVEEGQLRDPDSARGQNCCYCSLGLGLASGYLVRSKVRTLLITQSPCSG